MARYLARRLATSLVVVIGISIVVFLLLNAMSGAPGRSVLGPSASPEAVDAFNHKEGFDRPVVVQYLSYVQGLVQGDLGRSYKLNQDVGELLAQNAGRSAMLSLAALLLALAVAVPLGIYQARRRNRRSDSAITAATFMLYASPQFFLAVVAIEIFSVQLQLLPAQASQSRSAFVIFTDPRAMLLPILTLAAANIAIFARYQRSAALDQLGQDYIKVARAKGVSERKIVRSHLLRNSSLPLITLVGVSVPALLAGNLVIESVFNYPGLGLLFINSLAREDYPVLLAYTLIGGVLTVLGNLIGDLLVAIVDPRIELS
ncbi:ABC transporter permease [Nocardioides carbamazepini]|uniref:ABC transporter permease n=1 Tax=Nocardioides carbamazepini TaxID=2854259 RepID=UPI002149C5E9|nr:ABC transporter permease [Nocardioides carbamazepini]MCR1783817.1 ABC transporter permease [Nocardioides carbamazepini]